MRPFNLEEAKAGKPVCLRDGRPVRVICYDRRGPRPSVALLPQEYGDEHASYFYADGSKAPGKKHKHDLMMKDNDNE